MPQPPDGQGPTLEWFYPTKGFSASLGFIIAAIIVVFLILKDGGLGWMLVWWMWLFVLPWPAIFLLTGRNTRMSAGADWLCYGKDGFVRTYDLVKVTATVGGAARYLDLKDKEGNTLYVQMNNLQLNRELWDLVYNGILHSVHAGGAETNKLARDYLGLNVPPHLRQ